MAYKIGDKCICCAECAEACPMGIIKDAGKKFEINADLCMECGACALACPIENIKLDK